MASVLEYIEEIEGLLSLASNVVYSTTSACPRRLLRNAFMHATNHNLTEASRLIKEARKIMGHF